MGPKPVLKHGRQSTGLPCVGLKGTVVSEPHAEHLVLVSVRALDLAPPRFAMHPLQRIGSCVKPMSEKKSCSPAVNTKSVEQTEHFKTLSANCILEPSNHNQGDLKRARKTCRSCGCSCTLAFPHCLSKRANFYCENQKNAGIQFRFFSDDLLKVFPGDETYCRALTNERRQGIRLFRDHSGQPK